MRGLMLFADNFEDIEALGTLDLLRRAGLICDMVSITGSLNLNTQSGVKINAEKLYENINLKDYDFLIIPGGQAVFKTHVNSSITKNVVDYFINNKKLIGCICAAPMVLGNLGYLENKNYTCFPGCENESFKGFYHSDKNVCVDGSIITSKACGTTFDFAGEIIKYLLGEDTKNQVIGKVYYPNK